MLSYCLDIEKIDPSYIIPSILLFAYQIDKINYASMSNELLDNIDYNKTISDNMDNLQIEFA
jgi:hypothetical protein